MVESKKKKASKKSDKGTKTGREQKAKALAQDLHAHAAELEAAGVEMMQRAQRLRSRAFELTFFGKMTSAMAKDLVLRAAASLPGGKPYNPATPDSTPIEGGLINSAGATVSDGVWYFAQCCMTYGRFDTDGLVLWPEDVRANGKKLAGFVDCIMKFYKKR